MDYMDRMDRIKAASRHKQNQANVEFIRNQIVEKQARKANENDVERLYYKPHFGPEETLD